MLALGINQIGDEGFKALAAAIAGGSLASLERPHSGRSSATRGRSSGRSSAVQPRLSLGRNQASQAGKYDIKTAAEQRSIRCWI